MLRCRSKGQKGVAAVEFALVMPVVLVILLGIFEFGLAFWRKQMLTSAVREGARAGVVATNPKKTSSQIQTIVKDYLSNAGWDPNKATVTVTGAGGNQGTPLTVAGTYPSSFLLLSRMKYGGVKVDGAGNVTIDASVTMQME